MPSLSVVIPVRNEHENIGPCLATLWDALRDLDHEVLVAYDNDDDTTLPAIEMATHKSPRIRLVKNTLGRSPSFAIRSGLKAAEGEAVVVTMADLSDPPALIPRMAEEIRKGADLVVGSRYMRGGRQVGGPPLKSFLSRMAGLSLSWFAGVATHDATTSFRALSRRFLTEVPLESDTGFSVSLETTVKAHLRGLDVREVPSTWAERTAGTSNFKVGPWLGAYLRWYSQAMAEPAAVWLVWLVMVGATALGRAPITPLTAVAWAGSFAAILAVRRLRGRTTLLHAIIPALAWLALRLSG